MVALGDYGREHDGEPFGEEEWDEPEGEFENEELSLAEDDGRLPWLESEDYEDDSEGSGTGRLLLTFLIGLAAIAAILYGLWNWSNRSDPELVADGTTITAPDGPVKERPDDPGGKTFAGTGDVAPSVGEGQTREGRLAGDRTSPTGELPSGMASAAPRPSVAASNSRPPEAPATSGVGVQVGAYSSRAAAESGWSQLNRQTEILKGVRYRIMEGQIESGTVYRLQAMPGDAAAATALCGRLKSQGIPCQVKN